MAKTLSFDLTYDAPLGDVAEMLMQTSFREQVCDAEGATRKTVTIEPEGAGTRVLVDQSLPAGGMPGFAKRVVGDDIHLVQTEHWSGPTSATFELSIPGKPGDITGTIGLSESGGTTTEAIRISIRVAIPLVGGKIESLVVDLLARALRVENDVGRSYLAG